jgi:hypothetical protein
MSALQSTDHVAKEYSIVVLLFVLRITGKSSRSAGAACIRCDPQPTELAAETMPKNMRGSSRAVLVLHSAVICNGAWL